MDHSLQQSGTAAATSRADLVLGSGLRPIVYGGTSVAYNAFAGTSGQSRPALVLGVHSRERQLLGYLVINRAVSGATWGGMTVASDLTLDDALDLARATDAQIRLFGLHRGTHHGLVVVDARATPRERAEHTDRYLSALLELVRQGYCRIAFTSSERSLEPRLAARGAAGSAAASILAALEHAGEEPSLATIAIHEPTPLATEAAAAAVERGLRLTTVGDGALSADVDVLLVGGARWRARPEEVRAIRAGIVVSLAPVTVGPDAERRLHERGIVLIPYALSGAGLIFALDLRARGLTERSALARTSAMAYDRARELLTESTLTGESLPAVIRSHTS